MKEQQISSSMFQSSGESFPSNMLPIQESYFALQPNSSLISLPPASAPPLPPPLDSTVTPSVPSHFRLSYFPLRNDFGSQIIPRPYLTELHACFQADGLTQPPMRNIIASNSFYQGNTHPYTLPCSEQLLGSKMQPFPS
ncbi:hypothetical protein F3Y22_tig00002237pilonHSYRG00510 [Hibiscus syriacus]|uniref:Uncharacterized protein n=1 Tax=Hibiscus syriacus TaxID=106335 RepID=A0A6A3CY44_HIBSY|nr:hypothetical protein F3Y22_tig00002237pilonHSYRG00510 [Hibiscus syriacus]